VIGILVVTVTAVLLRLFVFKDGGRKKLLVTLTDPTVKYPLKLVDKEVRIMSLDQ